MPRRSRAPLASRRRERAYWLCGVCDYWQERVKCPDACGRCGSPRTGDERQSDLAVMGP